MSTVPAESKNIDLGVIVARIQCHVPTDAHKLLIEHVSAQCEKVLLVLGSSPVRNTIKNPLPFEVRKHAINDLYPTIDIIELPDYKSDSFWSRQLDGLIQSYCIGKWESEDTLPQVGLFGNRDSFISKYTGVYRTIEIELPIDREVSATTIRESIGSGQDISMFRSDEFRKGMIYAAYHRYPVSFQAVDVALVDYDKERVLVGKKPNEDGYRFIGGFVDPDDWSLEDAALRELKEEAGDNLVVDNLKYLGSFRIDDWRYRSENDKIMTALFVCDYTKGVPVASDDIESLEWIHVDNIMDVKFEPEHVALRYKLLKHLIHTIDFHKPYRK